ncbi:ABC transporter ATP-binding protein [Vampirovibrio chlorellavorus]|uniref:ABC transporter ATP-binding protein n=1 Tax=Vampirovibrio chlorellavorus TaxID=758823 RepID=UPI0026F2A173|nr:ABC transporter transmembrane domain-containing protein [Vampirovibrio chlorellavorus]
MRLFAYLNPYKKRFIIGLLATVPAASLNGALAFLIGPFIDKLLNSHQYSILFLVPIAILSASLLQGVCDYISTYYTTYVGTSISQDIRLQLYKHLSRMDQRYINQSSPGDLLTRYYSDPSRLQQAIVNHLQTFILESFSAAFLAAVLFYRSWQFALVALIIISFIFIPIRIISQKLRKLDNQTQEIMGSIYDVFNESVYASKVITIFKLKKYQLKRFEKGLDDYFGVSMRLTRADAILKPVMQMITAVGVSLIILFGSFQVQKGLMTPGEMTSFLVALVLLYKPIKNVGTIIGKIQRIFAPAERVFEKLDIEPSIQEVPDAPRVTDFQHLKFENVSFAYTPEKPVLKQINFEIKAGETIALVGESGGGKSTLVDLIPRFMDPQEGRITLNGLDLKSLSLDSVWDLFSIVTQETMLFDGSIRENIRLGKLDATDGEIERALQAANLKEFVDSLPNGLETSVGTRGVMLSGGQKQRIAIARAFLKNAPVVILDEATSALDNESEAAVQEAITNIMADKTVIVIAHRLSTIRFADRILVISDGKIAESGTHQELLDKQGIYSRLYHLQFRHDVEQLQGLKNTV